MELITIFPGALGATVVVERNGGGLSHILGQSFRRGGTCRHLRTGAPGASTNRCDQIDPGGTRLLWIGRERTIESLQRLFALPLSLAAASTQRIRRCRHSRNRMFRLQGFPGRAVQSLKENWARNGAGGCLTVPSDGTRSRPRSARFPPGFDHEAERRILRSVRRIGLSQAMAKAGRRRARN
jgi:hypothetical protein